jgi:hypothetical protein
MQGIPIEVMAAAGAVSDWSPLVYRSTFVVPAVMPKAAEVFQVALTTAVVVSSAEAVVIAAAAPSD